MFHTHITIDLLITSECKYSNLFMMLRAFHRAKVIAAYSVGSQSEGLVSGSQSEGLMSVSQSEGLMLGVKQRD